MRFWVAVKEFMVSLATIGIYMLNNGVSSYMVTQSKCVNRKPGFLGDPVDSEPSWLPCHMKVSKEPPRRYIRRFDHGSGIPRCFVPNRPEAFYLYKPLEPREGGPRQPNKVC